MPWRDWAPFTGSPYVDWWEETGYRSSLNRDAQKYNFARSGLTFGQRGTFADFLPLPVEGPELAGDPYSAGNRDAALDSALESIAAFIPSDVLNDVDGNRARADFVSQAVRDKLPKVEDPETVIVGIVDVGMPLGHRRLRAADGSTRILSAWQQMSTQPMEDLAFGEELYKGDIDAALAAASGGTLHGALDEDAFNRATRVVDMDNTFGEREAARRAAHGAHVLDLAAGYDTDDPEDAARADKIKVIAVNIPSIDIVGNAGELLDGFVLSAYERILAIADAIWEKSCPQTSGAYRTVINMSLGRQAGPKTGVDLIPAYLRQIKRRRGAQGEMLNFTMPAGNDNLTRCNAVLEPSAQTAQSLNWRILPQDGSPNYVEVWTAPPQGADTLLSNPNTVDVQLVPPSGDPSPTVERLEGAPPVPFNVKSALGNSAAVYREVLLVNKNGDNPAAPFAPVWLLRHVFAVAPTHRARNDLETAPAGLWQIRITNRTDQTLQCQCSIQTDQGLLPTSGESVRSFFDDPGYWLYDSYVGTGDLLETYAYPSAVRGQRLNQDLRPALGHAAPSPVKRHGTINSTAAHNAVARVAGYRASDGRPAFYSSAGKGRLPDARLPDDDSGTTVQIEPLMSDALAPTVSFPTEDSPMLPGILASGGADGSVAALRGTSFAAPQAARLIAERLVDGDRPDWSERKRLFEEAQKLEDGLVVSDEVIAARRDFLRRPPLTDTVEVIGGGRVPRQGARRIDRRGA
ncbi:MAG: S8 family serine peptidase [Pseudomonadota bacterium]